jgi:hypothetical protein
MSGKKILIESLPLDVRDRLSLIDKQRGFVIASSPQTPSRDPALFRAAAFTRKASRALLTAERERGRQGGLPHPIQRRPRNPAAGNVTRMIRLHAGKQAMTGNWHLNQPQARPDSGPFSGPFSGPDQNKD